MHVVESSRQCLILHSVTLIGINKPTTCDLAINLTSVRVSFPNLEADHHKLTKTLKPPLDF
jgi:hypothetical protein